MSPASTPTTPKSGISSSHQECRLKESYYSLRPRGPKKIFDDTIRLGDYVLSDFGYAGTVIDSIGTDFFFVSVAGYVTPGGWHREHLHKCKWLMMAKWLQYKWKMFARYVNNNEDVKYFTTNGNKK